MAMTQPVVSWPDGKRFAFTVCDDTDSGTCANLAPVYDLLTDLGLRTTKSCWAFAGDPSRGMFPGQTLDDADYRQWLLELQRRGFEIGWHGTTWHSAPREQIKAGLNRFAEVFGHPPKLGVNHTTVEEAIYWGSERVTGWRRQVYNLLTQRRNHGVYRGQVEGDRYFWGDLCRERIKYVRNFVFQDINTLKACPVMPYRDPRLPYVNYWFAAANGSRLPQFIERLSEANQVRLEAEGGACIMYTHFAMGFLENGRLNSRFTQLMKRLAGKNGWFVPVGTLLDHLLAVNGENIITDRQRNRLERHWLWERIRFGTI